MQWARFSHFERAQCTQPTLADGTLPKKGNCCTNNSVNRAGKCTCRRCGEHKTSEQGNLLSTDVAWRCTTKRVGAAAQAWVRRVSTPGSRDVTQPVRVNGSGWDTFTSGSSGGGSSTNSADISQESPTQPAPSPESLTSQAPRTPPTSPLLSECSGYDSLLPDRAPPSDSEIYRDRLQRKNLGYPLFIPGPNERLSEHYRESGVKPGDVGIFTPHGSFRHLFSIVHIPTHPRNEGVQLPAGFLPFAASPDECETEQFWEFDGVTGSYIADPSVVRVDSGEDPSRTVLQTSARETAVLALPEPVLVESILNLVPMRAYIRQNLPSWYAFVRDVKGWDVKNGDIRVVYSTRKSSGYGIATVCNSPANPTTELVFSVHEPEPGRCRYKWSHKGCATVKAGPSMRPGARQLVNQCLFVDTIDFKLGDEQWKAVEDGEVPLMSCRREQGSDFSEPSNHRFRGTCGTSSSDSSTVYSASTSSGSRSLNCSWEDLNIAKEDSSEDKVPIPSDILADVLLRAVPSASFVSVCTQDWGPYYTDSVEHVSDFVNEVLAANDICEENGVVYLEPKPLSSITANEDMLPNTVNAKVPDASMYESNVETNVYEKVAICLQEVSTVISVLDRIRLDRCISTLRACNASLQRIADLKAEISEMARAVSNLVSQGSESEPMENLDGHFQHFSEGLDSLVVDIQERAEKYNKSSRLKAFLSVGADQNAHSCYRRRLDTLLLDFQMYQKGLIQNYARKHQSEVSAIRLEGTTIWSDLPKGRQKHSSLPDLAFAVHARPGDKLRAYLHPEGLRLSERAQITWDIAPPTQKASARTRYPRKLLNEQLSHFQVGVDGIPVQGDTLWARYLPSEVPLDRRSHDEALDRIFKLCASWGLRCNPQLFLRDMHRSLSTSEQQTHPHTSHYSPMLHNALLSLALATLDESKFRDVSTRVTYADCAKRYIETECLKPSQSVVDALHLLAIFHSSQGDATLGYMYFGMSTRISHILSSKYLLEESDLAVVNPPLSSLEIKLSGHGLALDEQCTRFNVRELPEIGCYHPSSPFVHTMLEPCAAMPHLATAHIAYYWLIMIDYLVSNRDKQPLAATGQIDLRMENDENEVSKSVAVWLDSLDGQSRPADDPAEAVVTESGTNVQNGIESAQESDSRRTQLDVAFELLESLLENLANSGPASDSLQGHCSKLADC